MLGSATPQIMGKQIHSMSCFQTMKVMTGLCQLMALQQLVQGCMDRVSASRVHLFGRRVVQAALNAPSVTSANRERGNREKGIDAKYLRSRVDWTADMELRGLQTRYQIQMREENKWCRNKETIDKESAS